MSHLRTIQAVRRRMLGRAGTSPHPGFSMRGQPMDRTERFYKIELLLPSRGCVSFAALGGESEVPLATLKRDCSTCGTTSARKSFTTLLPVVSASAAPVRAPNRDRRACGSAKLKSTRR